LGPIDAEYRLDDHANFHGTDAYLRTFSQGLMRGIVDIFIKPLEMFYGLPVIIRNHQKEDERYRKLLFKNPKYNIGAEEGIRQRYSTEKLLRFWQRSEIDLIQASIDRVIMSTILDFLEGHGVDVSEIRNSTSVIMNSGIIVHQGNVSAQTLAVGDNSSARSIGGQSN
jgi:hypothetical protein